MRRTARVIGAALVLFAGLSAGLLGGIGPAAAGSAGSAAAAGVIPAAAGATIDCSYPITATDATGAEVTVEDEPERVVVLGPSAAQTMWEIGAEGKVVGMPVNRYTAYLDGSSERANVVGQYGQPIVERVVAQEPDLVLAPNIIDNGTVENLRSKGLTVYRFELARSLADVYAKTELTGHLVGELDAAGRVSARMQGQVAAIRGAVADEPAPRVFYNLGGGWTAGPNSFIGDVIATAGGDNVAAGYFNRSYAELSPEVVLAEDPEWILTTEGTPLPKHEGINRSTAIERDQIVTVDGNLLNQPAPRVIRPLRALAEALHPEAMAAVDLDAVETPTPVSCTTSMPTPTPSPSPSPTPEPEPESTAPTEALDGSTATATATTAAPGDTSPDAGELTTTGASGPGLGFGPTITALVGLVVVAMRRLS